MKRISIHFIIIYCVMLHLFWALFLSINPAAQGTTAVNSVVKTFGSVHETIYALILVSALSMCSTLYASPKWSFALLLPQQFILFVSATGAISAALAGQFADGVPRPPEFIAADQVDTVLAALFHALAIVIRFLEAKSVKRRWT